MTLDEQFEWWLRQKCDHDDCPYDHEVESFIYALRAEIKRLKEVL